MTTDDPQPGWIPATAKGPGRPPGGTASRPASQHDEQMKGRETDERLSGHR